MDYDVIVAMGSNLNFGDASPMQNVSAALRALTSHGLTVKRLSRFFATPSFPKGTGPDYVNACVVLKASHNPEAILSTLHTIETAFGRTRDTRWGNRTLDLDLLACGQTLHPDAAVWHTWGDLPLDAQKLRTPEELILPHPRLAERSFVLVPLKDVAAQWRHPVLGLTVAQMHDALPQADRASVIAL